MFLVLALACSAPPDTDPPGEETDVTDLPVTDTFPAFYGSVPKNLLIVSMDTFRRDLMTRYGGAGYAPFLDEKATEGMVLEHHRSCSNWTFPSVLCFNYGMTDVESGYVPDLRDPDNAWAPEGVPTLAGRLSAAGFRTMLVTSNGWFSADRNTDIGFDTSERPDDRRTQSVFGVGLGRLAETRAIGAERWYLHLHVKEAHPAYNPPPEYLAELEDLPPIDYDLTDFDDHYSADAAWPDMTEAEQALLLQHLLIRYHGEVRWMSDQLTDAFDALDEQGWLDDTLVLFWTDHGEQFWEHGDQTHAYGLNTEENDAVAFFWAKNIVPGSWEGPTSHIDLAPSVLSLYDVDATGVTGLPVGEGLPDRSLAFTSVARYGPMQSIVQDDWKLIYRWNTGERWLYDLANDPDETTDLWAADAPHAVTLEALLVPQVEALVPLTTRYTPY
jgi:arylsulfatase A-like enzyme